MSNLTYLHKVINQSVKNGEAVTYEETIKDGPKGITVIYFSKSKSGVEKISITGKDDKFLMKTIDGDKKDEKHINKKELLEELKKNKKLRKSRKSYKSKIH